MANIGAVDDHHARVRGDLPIELAVPDIDAVHAAGAPLEQAVGESARRRPYVHRHHASHIHLERIEGVGQLEPTARDKGHGFTAHAQHRARRQPISRLVHRLVAAQDLAGQNQGLRPFARRRQPLLENRHVRAHFAWPGRNFDLRVFGILLGCRVYLAYFVLASHGLRIRRLQFQVANLIVLSTIPAPGPPGHGAVAQLGERQNRTLEAVSSILISSTA